MRSIGKWCLAVSLLSLYSEQVVAEGWPRFRGPTGQGISSERNLPLRWSKTDNIEWKTEIPGKGWSSPIISGHRVFMTTAAEEGTSCRVVCVDLRSGKVLWNRQVFRQKPSRKEPGNSYATPTPATDGERVYAVFAEGSVAAVSFTGELLWTNREVEYYSRHGLGASPIVYEGLVIMPYDGSNRVEVPGKWPNNTREERLGWQIPWDKAVLVGLDARSGRRVWTGKRGLSRIAHTTPIILAEGEKTQLISPAGDVVQSFDPKTGRLLWTARSQGEGVVVSPVYGEGMVFTSSGFEDTTLRAVRTNGSGDVTNTHIVWEERKGCPRIPSLLFARSFLYAVKQIGVVTCYEATSGKIVYQNRLGGRYSASPVYAEGRIYILSENGETVVIAAGPDFKILARNPLGESCRASIAVSQGRLLIRSEKRLFCIGRKKL